MAALGCITQDIANVIAGARDGFITVQTQNAQQGLLAARPTLSQSRNPAVMLLETTEMPCDNQSNMPDFELDQPFGTSSIEYLASTRDMSDIYNPGAGSLDY